MLGMGLLVVGFLRLPDFWLLFLCLCLQFDWLVVYLCRLGCFGFDLICFGYFLLILLVLVGILLF